MASFFVLDSFELKMIVERIKRGRTCIFGVFFPFLNFLGQMDHKKITCFEEKNLKKFLVQVAPEPSTVEMLRHLIIYI